MKRTIAAIVTTLALMLGGTALAAPAQAVWGSTIHFNSCTYDGCTNPIRYTPMGGGERTLGWGNKRTDVFRVCPWSIGQRLIVKGPSGSTRGLEHGECYVPTKAATFDNPYLIRQQG